MDTDADFQLNRYWKNRRPKRATRPLLCLQGGGLKGGWQSGVVDALIKDNVISPIAAYGTSAGAINAVLISAKIANPEKDIFGNFWTSFCVSNIVNFLESEFLTIICRAPKTILGCLGWGRGNRAPGLFPFKVFQKLFEKHFPNNIKAKINTYIEITDLSCDNFPPRKLRFTGPSFWLHNGDNKFEVCFGSANSKVSINNALAASCCIPGLVNPAYICNRHVADGGLCTNLPIDQLPDNGSLGGDSIVFIITRPLSDFNPSKCDIDYHTLHMLHKIKKIQKSELSRSKSGRSGGYNILIGSPIFVIQPDTLPRLSNPFRLLWSRNMECDIEKGRFQGKKFHTAVNTALNGNITNLAKFHLFNIKLPPLPFQKPNLKFWYNFANRSWVNNNCKKGRGDKPSVGPC